MSLEEGYYLSELLVISIYGLAAIHFILFIISIVLHIKAEPEYESLKDRLKDIGFIFIFPWLPILIIWLFKKYPHGWI